MDNRYEIAEQNGMSREFAEWFFDNKKAGCGNVWFMMMAAMWEGWQGRAAMLQGADGNSPVIPDGWQLVPKQITLEMECALSRADSYEIGWRWALAAAPQQDA
jgi:hypothetical protein